MNPLALALLIVAALLFLIDAFLWWFPPTGWSSGRLQSLGLLFFVLGVIASGGNIH